MEKSARVPSSKAPSKKRARESRGDEDEEEKEKDRIEEVADVDESPTKAVTESTPKPYPKTVSTRAKASTISPTQLLPPLNELQWVAVVARADTLVDMASYLKPLNPDITLYPTDKRVLVKPADETGPAQYSGFRGIAIDAMDQSAICVTVARLAERVCLNPDAGDLDALPELYSPLEIPVMVKTDLLVSLLADIPSSDTVVLYVTKAEDHLLYLVNCDTEGQLLTQNLKILGGPKEHPSIRALNFRYEMQLPLSRIKNTVKRAAKIKADRLKLRMWGRADGSLVLTMKAEGDGATVYQPVLVGFVPDIDGDSKTAEDKPDAGDKPSMTEACARLKGFDPRLGPLDNAAPILRTDINKKKMKPLFKGTYSVKYLKCMLAPISGGSLLNLFLCVMDNGVSIDDSPLLMRFDLHKYESFVTYVLASLIPKDKSED